jgi:hypothetical protein
LRHLGGIAVHRDPQRGLEDAADVLRLCRRQRPDMAAGADVGVADAIVALVEQNALHRGVADQITVMLLAR